MTTTHDLGPLSLWTAASLAGKVPPFITGRRGLGTFVLGSLENWAVFVDGEVAVNEYVPLPVTALVTSISTQVPAVMAPSVATGWPEIVGALFHTTVLSDQSLETLDSSRRCRSRLIEANSSSSSSTVEAAQREPDQGPVLEVEALSSSASLHRYLVGLDHGLT